MWYAVLTRDLDSAFGTNINWRLYIENPQRRPPIVGDVRLYDRGYRATTDPMKTPWLGMRVFEVDVDEPPVKSANGIGMWSTMGLGRERPDLVPGWWHKVETFLDEVRRFPWLDPQDDPLPSWRLFETRREAIGGAGDALFSSAWRAARNSSYRIRAVAERESAAAGRVRAFNMACDIAHTRALVSASDTLCDLDPKLEVALDAARDITAWAAVLVCDDLNLPPRYVEHAARCLDAWRRGYGVLGVFGLFRSLNGTLYVYKGIEG